MWYIWETILSKLKFLFFKLKFHSMKIFVLAKGLQSFEKNKHISSLTHDFTLLYKLWW